MTMLSSVVNIKWNGDTFWTENYKPTFSERFGSSRMWRYLDGLVTSDVWKESSGVIFKGWKFQEIELLQWPLGTELFDPTDKDTRFFRNVGNHRPTNTAPHPRTTQQDRETPHHPKHFLQVFITTDQWYKEKTSPQPCRSAVSFFTK
jgi:hypothetical protein